MMTGTALAALGCFVWGIISVALSPCHLASIPLIVTYVAGQDKALKARHAANYAAVFTIGLFITIAMVGIICSLLGRMLGEVGPYWTMLVGAILIWVALDMLGIAWCSMSSGLLGQIKIKGLPGAFLLGLAYGVLSGSCTFGFIAPILAIITIQQKVVTGIVFIVLFGIGHCIPIAIAGSSTATVKRLLESSSFYEGGLWFRRCAGVGIGLLGVYFILRPYLENHSLFP
jgi:cytochrome c-type biogenesis protein